MGEYVMVPREWLQDLVSAGAGEPVSRRDLETAAKALAEQHQGEPVALPERKQPRPQGDWTSPETYRENLGWNACLDEIAKLGQLHTHADPGEVERKLEDQRREFAHAQTVEHRKWAELVDGLKAQLAERDALLRDSVKQVRLWQDGELLLKIVTLLSASAEPSAPVERDERAEFERWYAE